MTCGRLFVNSPDDNEQPLVSKASQLNQFNVKY